MSGDAKHSAIWSFWTITILILRFRKYKKQFLKVIVLQEYRILDWDLHGEMKPVVTEKFEMEYGKESKSLALKIFGLSEF